MKKLFIACLLFMSSVAVAEFACNDQKMNMVVVDFNKIYNESLELTCMQKKLAKGYETYQEEYALYAQQVNINQNQSHEPYYNGEWFDKEKDNFRKRLQPVIEEVAKLHCAHIVLASKKYNDFRWDVLCLKQSYDITDEIIKIMNKQYLKGH